MTNFKCMLTLFLCAFLSNAFASENSAPHTDIHLQVRISHSAVNDTMTAHLYVEKRGYDLKEINHSVVQSLNAVTTLARSHDGVKIQTGNRSVTPVMRNEVSEVNGVRHHGQVQEGWKERAELTINGSSFEQVSALLALASSDMVLQNMTFGLSRESRTRSEASLVSEVIASFHEQAAVITRSMGQSQYRVISLTVGDGGISMPGPMVRMASLQGESMAMELESGETEIVKTASGQIRLAENAYSIGEQ